MSVLKQLASALGRSDEGPNLLLAQQIAEAGDDAAVAELAANLTSADKDSASDCIKVLYEVGALKPQMIAAHVDAFAALLGSRNNRLVWGAMTALGTVAPLDPAALRPHIERIMQATETGSVITQDWGVRALAAVAAADRADEARIFPFLLNFLQNCPPKDLPRHAESVLIAVHAGNRGAVLPVLAARAAELKPAQAKRLAAVVRKISAL